MNGHTAMVTGGAQSIGTAIVRIFAGAGANVMIVDLNGEKAEVTAAKISAETGGKVIGIQRNVTDQGDIDACVKKTA